MNEQNSNRSFSPPSDHNCRKSYPENFKSSTPIATKSGLRIRNDSAYSSFISPKTHVTMNSASSSLMRESQTFDSPATSYSSRNSVLANDEEVDGLFNSPVDAGDADRSSGSFFISDSFFRRSARNSPWTNRPESAPLNEEEEDDSDKEASSYCCDAKDIISKVTDLPEIVQCTLRCRKRVKHYSMSEADNRNEIIANKLQEIADKLPKIALKKTRHKSWMFSSEKTSSSSSSKNKFPKKRHSYSSFIDMVPDSTGSVLDLIFSFYSIYRHSQSTHKPPHLDNSQSIPTQLNTRQRLNNRSRSFTQ